MRAFSIGRRLRNDGRPSRPYTLRCSEASPSSSITSSPSESSSEDPRNFIAAAMTSCMAR
jgi:hypothetical protein